MPLSTPQVVAVLCALMLLVGCGQPPRPTVNLYRAVQIGDLDQIKRHLYWGTDADRPGPGGDYPLHVAARQGKVVIAKALLRHGVSLDARDRLGRTPLHLALASGKVPMARMLRQRGADDDLADLLPVLVADGAADRDTIAWLVDEHGVDPDASAVDGRTPLQIAVANGDVKLAKRLILAGADVNRPDPGGATPLVIAGGDQAMARLLQQYGAER